MEGHAASETCSAEPKSMTYVGVERVLVTALDAIARRGVAREQRDSDLASLGSPDVSRRRSFNSMSEDFGSPIRDSADAAAEDRPTSHAAIGRTILSEVACIRRDLESCKQELQLSSCGKQDAHLSINSVSSPNGARDADVSLDLDHESCVDPSAVLREGDRSPNRDLIQLRDLLSRQQSVNALKDEVQGLQRGMKVQCDRHEDLSEWAERAIANETEELRRDVRRLLQAEREARDEQTSEILMVLDALREEVARTNANLEARSAPDALYQAISQSGQMSAQSRALGQHQEQLERLTSASALLAEELTKFDATDTTNSVSSKLDEISTRFDRRFEELCIELQKKRARHASLDTTDPGLSQQLGVGDGELDARLRSLRVKNEACVSALGAEIEEERRQRTRDTRALRERLEEVEGRRWNRMEPPTNLDFDQHARSLVDQGPMLLARVDAAERLLQALAARVGDLLARVSSLEEHGVRGKAHSPGSDLAAVIQNFEAEQRRVRQETAMLNRVDRDSEKNCLPTTSDERSHLCEVAEERLEQLIKAHHRNSATLSQMSSRLEARLEAVERSAEEQAEIEHLFERVERQTLAHVEESRRNASAVSSISEKVEQLQQHIEDMRVKQRADEAESPVRATHPAPHFRPYTHKPIRFSISSQTKSHESLRHSSIDF